MLRQYVYRQPPQYRPQYYRARDYRPYTLSWLYNKATQQYVTANVTGGLPALSLFQGASPAVATGDVFVADLVDSLGSPITLNPNGTFSIASGGSEAARTFGFNVYSIALSAFHGAQTAFVNDAAPIFSSTEVVIAVERNQTITPVDMSGRATDPEGDALTWTLLSSAPGTIGLSSLGVWSGLAPDANSITTQNGLVTDTAGNAVPWTATLIVGRVLAPDLVGDSQSAAAGELAASYLNIAIGVAVNSATIPVGFVAAQSPAANNEAAPFSTVTIQLSLGSIGLVTVTGPIMDQAYAQGSAQTLDLSPYFAGAVAYAMKPAISLSGETLIGQTFTPQTAIVGTFGPFAFSGINGVESATLNEFHYTVTGPAAPANPVRAIRFSAAAKSIRFSVVH